MKLINKDDNIVIYLNKAYSLQIDVKEPNEIEQQLNNLLNRLFNYYKVNISGNYTLEILNDNHYGQVIIIKKQHLDYIIPIFDTEIDIVVKLDQHFLYEINDVFINDKNLLKKILIYNYDGKTYFYINEDISNIEMGKLLEHCSIIYGDLSQKILSKGKIVYMH